MRVRGGRKPVALAKLPALLEKAVQKMSKVICSWSIEVTPADSKPTRRVLWPLAAASWVSRALMVRERWVGLGQRGTAAGGRRSAGADNGSRR